MCFLQRGALLPAKAVAQGTKRLASAACRVAGSRATKQPCNGSVLSGGDARVECAPALQPAALSSCCLLICAAAAGWLAGAARACAARLQRAVLHHGSLSDRCAAPRPACYACGRRHPSIICMRPVRAWPRPATRHRHRIAAALLPSELLQSPCHMPHGKSIRATHWSHCRRNA